MADCATCGGRGWVCENHPDKGWEIMCDCGAGMPCPACNTETRYPLRVTSNVDRGGLRG